MVEFENESFMRKNAIWLVVLVAFGIFGLLLFKGYDKVVNEGIDGKMETITGTFTCLPFKDGAEINDDNCVLGVESKEETYYALDISRIQDVNTDLKVEDTVAVTGFVKSEADVAGSKWAPFSVVGIIQVNTLLRTR